MDRFPNFVDKIERFCQRNTNLIANMASPAKPGYDGRFMFSILTEEKLRRVLTRMLDEDHFFGPHGVRALSRWHKDQPYV